MARRCMCGDVYCPSCGDPSLAVLEEAESSMMEAFGDASFTPDEYALVTMVGLAAVASHRDAVAKATWECLNEAELVKAEFADAIQAEVLPGLRHRAGDYPEMVEGVQQVLERWQPAVTAKAVKTRNRQMKEAERRRSRLERMLEGLVALAASPQKLANRKERQERDGRRKR